MAFFSSGIPLTSLGYSYSYVQPNSLIADRGSGTLNSILAKTGVPAFSDPRGADVPGATVSYRVNNTALAALSFVDPQAPIGGGFDATVVRGKAITQVSIFEGSDVVDQVTDEFKSEGDYVTFPTNVFRVFHAGSNKLINTPQDDLAARAAVSFFAAPTDTVKGTVVKTENAPRDFGEDILSNKVKFSGGKPKYVSYVSVSKPICVDMIYVEFSATAIAFGQLLQDASPLAVKAYVLRYIPTLLNGVMSWRLSETFGIKLPNVERPKPNAVRTSEEITVDRLADVFNHYVYDLSKADGLSTEFPPKPSKQAHIPSVAKEKQNPASKLYDKDFVSVVYGFDTGVFSSGTDVAPQNTFGSNILQLNYTYTSPIWKFESKRIRIASNITTDAFLTKTSQLATGLACFYMGRSDARACSTRSGSGLGLVFNVGKDIPALTQRIYDDSQWVSNNKELPKETKLNQFMIGEHGQRSDGMTLFYGLPKFVKDVASIGADYVVGVEVSASPANGKEVPDHSFRLFTADDKENPAYEGQGIAGITYIFETPPIKVTNIETGNGSKIIRILTQAQDQLMYKSLKTAKPEEIFTGNDNNSKAKQQQNNKLAQAQFDQMEDLKFPGAFGGVTACADISKRFSMIGFENDDSICLAFRRNLNDRFLLIRDVTRRIRKNALTENPDPNKASTENLPKASSPQLLMDRPAGACYLFYVYKQALMMKSIATDIFGTYAKIANPNNLSFGLTPESERGLAERIQSSGAVIVYDQDAENKDLEYDISIREASKPIKEIKPGPAGAAPVSTGEPKPIDNYSAFIDGKGAIYVIIQTDKKSIMLRSGDKGRTWEQFVDDFSMIPKTLPGSSPSEATSTPEKPEDRVSEIVTFLHDETVDVVHSFFFKGGCLLTSRYPLEYFKLNKNDAKAKFESVTPLLLVGKLPKELENRGIKSFDTVNDFVETDKTEKNDKKPITLQPHRVCGYLTKHGAFRMFFKDDKSILRSVVSQNRGSIWVSETKYIQPKDAN